MKRLFNIFAMLALLAGFTACESGEEGPAKDPVVKLTANKTEIEADGFDKVTFEVTVDGVVTTNDVQIILLNDNSILSDTTFTTKVAGEYRFKAAYKNVTSETITVKATITPLVNVVLTADKSEIIGDGVDTVTFTVTVDGQDKTAEATIINVLYSTTLEGNTFTSDVAGEYTFMAQYENATSEEVVITVKDNTPTQKSLTITTSKYRIASDGVDSATFTVLYGEEDVTAECEFHTTTGTVIEGSTFSTTTVGTYNIYALYNNTRSNTVSIDVYDPAVVGDYEIGTLCEVNGTTGVIYAIKTDKNNYTWVYVVSLDEEYLQWSTENVWCNCISDKGSWNTYDPFDERYSNADGGVRDINNYPAFAWCMGHGENWFLPSSMELQWLWDSISGGTHTYNCAAVEAFNKVITDNGGVILEEDYYWSSNETSFDNIELVAFMENSVICLEPYKTKKYRTRAVARFNI